MLGRSAEKDNAAERMIRKNAERNFMIRVENGVLLAGIQSLDCGGGNVGFPIEVKILTIKN